MNNNINSCEETVTSTTCGRPSGLLIAIVLYILLVIILSSLRAC